MSYEKQYLLFNPEPFEDQIHKELAEMRILCERMRKAQFMKISEIKCMMTEIKHDLEVLKMAICKGKIYE